MAHEDILRRYLEGVVGEGLQAFHDATQARTRMTDGDELARFLASLPSDRMREVISALEVYEDEFRHDEVIPTAVALLNILPAIPDHPKGMFELDNSMVVGRVVYRLVRSLKDPEIIESAVRSILPDVWSLSCQWRLISIVGHREGVGHKLVSEQSASQLEHEWREGARAASVETLAGDKDLLRVLLSVKRGANQGEPTMTILDDPAVTLAALKSARSEVRSQGMGSRAVRRSPRLAWDALVEVYGTDAILRERVQALRDAQMEVPGDLLDLADKYLAGWRPKDRDE